VIDDPLHLDWLRQENDITKKWVLPTSVKKYGHKEIYITMDLVLLCVSILYLICNIFILNEMFSLKKRGCDCATDEWRRIFIMIATLFFIVAFFVSFALSFFHPMILIFLGVTMGVVGLMNVIVTRQFIMRMNDENCACATERGVFKLMNIINLLQIIGFVMFFILQHNPVILAKSRK
jgi:hypothetical protein